MSVEERYYKLNRTLLKVLGLWPYRHSKWVNVQVTMIIILYLSIIFVQFAVFTTHDCTLDLIISVLSFAFLSIFILVIYILTYFCSDAFKEVMEHIYYDWKSCKKNKTEFDILDNYASMAKLLTEIFFFTYVIVMFATAAFHGMPFFLDIVLPLNESRPHAIHIEVEYFVDPAKYIILFIMHTMIFAIFGILTVVASGSMFYGYLLHACAVFKITSYRMKMTIDEDVLQITSSERDLIILDKLICAVKLHRRNLTYCNSLILLLGRSFLVILIIGIASLSIDFFRLMQAMKAHDDIMEIFISLVLVLSHICYVFFANHIGQQITNNNAEIFDSVYNVRWYLVSTNVQKIILFLLRKGNRDVYLSVGGIFDASYECFSTILTTAISYFTVIYSVH